MSRPAPNRSSSVATANSGSPPAPSPYQLIGPSDATGEKDILAHMPMGEARQRLQALIADWLRMENVVVLTGAGCSVLESIGGKTLADLETCVLKSLQACQNLPESIKPIIEERLKPKANRAAWAQSGFEQWLSYIVNALYLAKNPNSPFSGFIWHHGQTPTVPELEWFVSFISKSIFSECALVLPEPMNEVDIAPQIAFLSKLVARDSNLGRPHLFTLNYDTLFEQALELLGIQYFDGFTGRADARFDPSVYGLDIYYPGEVAEGRVRRFDKFLHFYKLHGSVHWHDHNGSIRSRHPALHEYQDFRAMEPNGKADFIEALDEFGKIGILPTANKFAQTLAMPYAHLFRSLQLRLSVPQTFLLVLGYGFGDDHVNQIIDMALTNPSLVMLVVEPNPDSEVINRIKQYKDLGKRAFVLTATADAHQEHPFAFATFSDFAQSIMPNVQWLDDFLRLRRFEKQMESIKSTSRPQED